LEEPRTNEGAPTSKPPTARVADALLVVAVVVTVAAVLALT
jgi:hypothetical protein